MSNKNEEQSQKTRTISRRALLKMGGIGALALAFSNLLPQKVQNHLQAQSGGAAAEPSHAGMHGSSGKYSNSRIMRHGYDPMKFLTEFDYGTVTTLANGQTQREYQIFAQDREIEVAPGVYYPAWTYNGNVPGPTLRCTEGDHLKINFINGSSHPHTIHFHGIHPGNMDGVYEIIPPGETYTYEFDAAPFGLHVYHCHASPLKKHIEKGLYGTFIIDPPKPRSKMKEMVMVMSGFDTNFDGGNEFYTVNGVANYYHDYPIPLKVGEKVRIYLSNMTEFDLINSFHLHGDMFRYYATGTNLEHFQYTDTIMQCQGERGIIEFAFTFPGKFMFHAHQSEFAELGWMGVFDVTR